MIFTPTELKDATIIDIEPFQDERGFFARAWCQREFQEQGLVANIVQANMSYNRRKGTLRGMHYQTAPHEEAKLVWCTRGAIFDVCLYLRRNSPTFGKWEGFELSADNASQLYIPTGCAHGFQTLTDDTEVFYRISQYYAPEASTGVRFDDPAFAIRWPLPITTMSDRDRSFPYVRV